MGERGVVQLHNRPPKNDARHIRENAGTRHAIALKPRESYCNLERLHNRNQPFLRVYRNFISLHLNYVVQWLCKSMLNCSPVIDYQLVKWYILLSDAEPAEYQV